MNPLLLPVLILLSSLLTIFLDYQKKKKQLAEADAKLKIANEKISLYQLFVSNAPVKKFFRFIDTVNLEVFDVDIKAMLVKYFDKVFINLSIKHVMNLVTDIKALKHSGIVMDAFFQANQRVGMDLIGLSLAGAIQENDNERLLVINELIELLPSKSKKAQIEIAIKLTESYINNELMDLPSSYRRPIEQALSELKKRIE